VHASQVLGERFFEALATAPWRLRPPERLRPVSGFSGKGLKEPIPLAAQVFNQDCPFTLITVAMPAWLFGGIGGFDRSNQLYDANDFVQRVQMMDPGVPVQTWTGPAPVGSKGSGKGKQAEHQRKCNTCGGPCHCEYQDEMGEQLCWLCYHSDQTMWEPEKLSCG